MKRISFDNICNFILAIPDTVLVKYKKYSKYVTKQKIKNITLFPLRKIILFFYRLFLYCRHFFFLLKKAFYYFYRRWQIHILVVIFSIMISQYIAFSSAFLSTPVSGSDLSNVAATIGSLIGTAIAIIFTLSTFILQSTADLFSTQYLKKFIKNTTEKIIFGILVIFLIASFFISFVSRSYIFGQETKLFLIWVLMFMVLITFYLIFVLYIQLREMIDPEVTLVKIRNFAIIQLKKTKIKFQVLAFIQGFVNENKPDEKGMLLDTQYRVHYSWSTKSLLNIRYLYEILLRLLSKNEVESSKMALLCIHDVYLTHLVLRSGSFVRMPVGLIGMVYTTEDQSFTTTTLEYLSSIGSRLILEKRKENIIYLLSIYKSMFVRSLDVRYVDQRHFSDDNPIASLILAYYKGFIESILETKDIDLVWETIKSINVAGNLAIKKTSNHLLLEPVDRIFDEISNLLLHDTAKLSSLRESALKEVVRVFFNRMTLIWDMYPNDRMLWDSLFKNLKKHLMHLKLVESGMSLSASEVFINFHSWQGETFNKISELEDGDEKDKKFENYMTLLERWSDFLIDFSRDFGIRKSGFALEIVQSIENNLRIISFVRARTELDTKKVRDTQLSILSWYFYKVDTLEKYSFIDLDSAFGLLLTQLYWACDDEERDNKWIKDIVNRYIRLVSDLDSKIINGHGYDNPRIIVKLVPLGVILQKYNESGLVDSTLETLVNLNNRYIKNYKDLFQLKEGNTQMSGPDQYQLCKEISNMKEDVYGWNRTSYGINYLLNKISNEDDWNNLTMKINHCNGITYSRGSI